MLKLLASIAAAALFLFSAQTASADPAGDLDRSILDIMKKSGEGGGTDSKESESEDYKLGMKYFLGDGVLVDSKRAFAFFKKAADNGEAKAIAKLGVLCLFGVGTDQNTDLALRYYKEAAGKGDAGAQHALGCIYAEGKHVKRDVNEAIKWHSMAAEQNYSAAQLSLGAIYAEGYGVDDIQKALDFLQKAVDNGNDDACVYLGLMYAQGSKVKQDFKKAFDLFHRAAQKNNPYGQINLGNMYEQGYSVYKNAYRAVELYKDAALQGNEEAQLRLCQIYYEGIYNDKYEEEFRHDYGLAQSWCEKATKYGNPNALYYLGEIYYLGNGVTEDKPRGLELARKAAEKGHIEAHNRLRYAYSTGNGTDLDCGKAARHLDYILQHKPEQGLYIKGSTHEFGDACTRQDWPAARDFYKAACRKGHSMACMSYEGISKRIGAVR